MPSHVVRWGVCFFCTSREVSSAVASTVVVTRRAPIGTDSSFCLFVCLPPQISAEKESKTHHTTSFCVCTLALKKMRTIVQVDLAGANE